MSTNCDQNRDSGFASPERFNWFIKSHWPDYQNDKIKCFHEIKPYFWVMTSLTPISTLLFTPCLLFVLIYIYIDRWSALKHRQWFRVISMPYIWIWSFVSPCHDYFPSPPSSGCSTRTNVTCLEQIALLLHLLLEPFIFFIAVVIQIHQDITHRPLTSYLSAYTVSITYLAMLDFMDMIFDLFLVIKDLTECSWLYS